MRNSGGAQAAERAVGSPELVELAWRVLKSVRVPAPMRC